MKTERKASVFAELAPFSSFNTGFPCILEQMLPLVAVSVVVAAALAQHPLSPHSTCYTAHAPCTLSLTTAKQQQHQQTHLRRSHASSAHPSSSPPSTWTCGLQQHVWTRAHNVSGCVARVSCVGVGCELDEDGDWSVWIEVRRCDLRDDMPL
jgi:hypothetical protein